MPRPFSTTLILRTPLGRFVTSHVCSARSKPFSPIKKCMFSTTSPTKSSSIEIDTAIIGGGVMGSSTAYHLAKSRLQAAGDNAVLVIERDPTYKRASSSLSAGGIRQQFSLKENILMGMYGRDFMRTASHLLTSEHRNNQQMNNPVDVQFRECGYLFLTSTQQGKQRMMANHQLQTQLGCDILLLDPDQLRAKFGSWLNVDDIVMGSYGRSGEGWVDPWILIQGMKNKAMEMGVTYVHGKLVGATRDETNGRVTSIQVQLLTPTSISLSSTNNVVTYHVNNIVNAAGPQASTVMDILAGGSNLLRYPLPVRARKRCVFYFHCSASDGVPPSTTPLTIDATCPVYFRPEGHSSNTFVCGVSPSALQDPDCSDERELDVVQHEFFDGVIWPALYNRVPAFGEIKVKSSWAGFYEYNTVDQNAIIGFHPELRNVLLVNGFSGHGLMQSPAAGRAAAELLDNEGTFQTLDLSIFGFERFMEGGTPVFEEGIV